MSTYLEQHPMETGKLSRSYPKVMIRTKSLEGYKTRVVMGVTTFQEVDLDELIWATQGHPGCRKEKFDPNMDRFEQVLLLSAPELEPWNTSIQPQCSVIRIYTRPSFFGLISARVSDDVTNTYASVGQGRYLNSAVGVVSPLAAEVLADVPALAKRLESDANRAATDGPRKCTMLIDYSTGTGGGRENIAPKGFWS